MALNMDAIGKTIGPLTRDYTWKDVVLYALGVGAGFADLEYCYEKDLKVIPSFAIAAIFDLVFQIGAASKFNPAGILHGEQELIFYNPIPTQGTLTTEAKITRYYDKGRGKGALVVTESETFDSSGKKLFTGVITMFARLDGGFGGENAPQKAVGFPDQDPDFVVDACPSADQPLLYRLSGDTFDLHVNSEFAQLAGFEKPIMHGLCTHGYACRALIHSLIPGHPEKARRMDCRFAKPLYSGTPIQTFIWKTAEGQAVWRTVNTETGEAVIDKGVFEYGDILPLEENREISKDVEQEAAAHKASYVSGIFEALADVFNPEAAKGLDMEFQYDISGSDGGKWSIAVKDGVCQIVKGMTDHPDCTLKIADTDFVDMMQGRLDPIQAFISGKLIIEGDITKAQLIEKLFPLKK